MMGLPQCAFGLFMLKWNHEECSPAVVCPSLDSSATCVHNGLHMGDYLITYLGIVCWTELQFQLHWMQMSNMKSINRPQNTEFPFGNFKPEPYINLKISLLLYETCCILGNKYQRAGILRCILGQTCNFSDNKVKLKMLWIFETWGVAVNCILELN